MRCRYQKLCSATLNQSEGSSSSSSDLSTRSARINGHEPLNILRYRKTVSSALWIQFALVTCYFPMIVITLMAIRGMIPTLLVAWTYSSALMFFNSTLNSILCFWKKKGVRRTVLNIIPQI